MTIAGLISFGAKSLKNFSPTPFLDAEVLLAKTVGKGKEYLYAHSDKEIKNARQVKYYKDLLKKRVAGKPISYLVNNKEFYGLDFFVNQSVLNPRPETELIIDETINLIKNDLSGKRFTIADIGTGSGCIAITLAKLSPEKIVRVYASDTSKKALLTAKKNAKKHKVDKKIKFIAGSLLEPLRSVSFDILIANLPYLSSKEKKKYYTQCPDIAYEPDEALFAKNNGAYWYQKLFDQLRERRQKPKTIFLEVDHYLAKNLPGKTKNKRDAFLASLNKLRDFKVKIINDLNGFKRIIKLERG